MSIAAVVMTAVMTVLTETPSPPNDQPPPPKPKKTPEEKQKRATEQEKFWKKKKKKELLKQFAAMSDHKESQEFLHKHPELLVDAAEDSLLVYCKQLYSEKQDVELIKNPVTQKVSIFNIYIKKYHIEAFC